MYRSFISLASNTISRATAFNPVLSQARNIIVNYRPDAQLGETADAATMITQLDNDLLARLKSTDTLKRKVPSTPSKRFWLRLDRSELWKGRYVYITSNLNTNILFYTYTEQFVCDINYYKLYFNFTQHLFVFCLTSKTDHSAISLI